MSDRRFSVARIVGLSAVVTACLAVSPCLAQADVRSGPIPEIVVDEAAIRAAGITLSPVARERGATDLAFPGVVAVPPAQMRVVAAPVDGLIESVEVATGESVVAGQTILRLRSPRLVEAQREFVASVADAALADDRTRRSESLFAAKALPERDLRVIQNESRTAGYREDERYHVLKLMGMPEQDIETLRRTREFKPSLTIVAPKSGIVLDRLKSPGERVDEASPLFTIATLDPLWLNIQVPVSRLGTITPGSRVSLPAQGTGGKVIRVGRTVDPATQSVTAVAEIETNGGSVRPGLAVTVNVRLDRASDTQWVVPAPAVVRHRDRSWIFVRTPGGFRPTPVTVVAENARDVSIKADLAASDQVANKGIIALLAELAKSDSE